MNLLLLLTALLTSLTGMISGERAGVSRVQASASAVEQNVEAVVDNVVAAAILAVQRPNGVVFAHVLPLPRAFALVPAIRLAAEQRRE